jgi:F0F1-type ATP synthase membrane subunit b/b'
VATLRRLVEASVQAAAQAQLKAERDKARQALREAEARAMQLKEAATQAYNAELERIHADHVQTVRALSRQAHGVSEQAHQDLDDHTKIVVSPAQPK